MRAWVAAVVLLGGCAESHVACVGALAPGDYSLTFTPTGPAQPECPDSLRDIGALDGSIVPPRCEPLAEAAGQCGSTVRFRCDTRDVTGSLVAYEATADVSWTTTGAEGGADVIWLDDSGAVACSGAYDLTIAPL